MSIIIDKLAVVHPKAEIGDHCFIGPFCTVGEHARIGHSTTLRSHVIVDEHTTIGDECDVFPLSLIHI